MTLKNLKRLILFSGFFTLFSIQVSGQYLRNNIISAEANVGFLQQKVSIGYQYDITHFKSYKFKERKSQFFAGVEIASVKLRYKPFDNLKFDSDGDNFQSKAAGTGILFSLSRVNTTLNRKGKYKFNYLTLKAGINTFQNVKSTMRAPSGSEGSAFWTGKASISNARCQSYDFEFDFGKIFKLNSFNLIKIGMFTGIRMGKTSGIKHVEGFDAWKVEWYKRDYYFSQNLIPFILGFNLSYQFNFGKRPEPK